MSDTRPLWVQAPTSDVSWAVLKAKCSLNTSRSVSTVPWDAKSATAPRLSATSALAAPISTWDSVITYALTGPTRVPPELELVFRAWMTVSSVLTGLRVSLAPRDST